MLPLPIQLTETKDSQVRELAFAAQKYGTAGIRNPGDFEAIYNHGLALQELALRCSETREDQEALLRQVSLPESSWAKKQICLLISLLDQFDQIYGTGAQF